MPDPHTHHGFQPAATLAAVACPGLGHVLRGERRRGFLIAAGILGLFFGGILIGGIDVVDSAEDAPWFYGQALVGPIAFATDYLHQHHFKVHAPVEQRGPDGRAVIVDMPRSAYPKEARGTDGRPTPGSPPNIKSLSKVNELGTLFATIAGMLNVIAVLDAAFPPIRRTRAADPTPRPDAARGNAP